MRLSVRLYRLLMKLYPAGFREQYTVPMQRQFEEDHAEVRGPRARIRFWMGTLFDVARSAPLLFAREVASDSRHTFRLWRARPLHTVFAMLVLAAPPRKDSRVTVSTVGTAAGRCLPWRTA